MKKLLIGAILAASLTGCFLDEGDDGDDGRDGIGGTDGAAGPAGPAGRDGIQGIQGHNGNNGSVGIGGMAGPAGRDGPAGANGLPGLNGHDGAPGAPGAAGATGPQGRQGEKGDGAGLEAPFLFSGTFKLGQKEDSITEDGCDEYLIFQNVDAAYFDNSLHGIDLFGDFYFSQKRHTLGSSFTAKLKILPVSTEGIMITTDQDTSVESCSSLFADDITGNNPYHIAFKWVSCCSFFTSDDEWITRSYWTVINRNVPPYILEEDNKAVDQVEDPVSQE